MTIARRHIVFEGGNGTYHCISRCVRRAFLCGMDPWSNKNYAHRKQWIQFRLKQLSEIFAVEVCAYSVMSNHLHVVLKLRPDLVASWAAVDIARRWCALFPKSRDAQGKAHIPDGPILETMTADAEKIASYADRLQSLSWFMRCLNENIARRANREDQCKGRFWEGRFKSVALLDEAAVLACCAYVDLNPIRANIADTPETSDYTSIQDRILARSARARKRNGAAQSKTRKSKKVNADQHHNLTNIGKGVSRDRWLCPFQPTKCLEIQDRKMGYLPMALDDYLRLVEWTGSQLRVGKAGRIPDGIPNIFRRLDIVEGEWLHTVRDFGSMFHRVAGTVQHMTQAAKKAGQQWLQGCRAGRRVFGGS